MVVSIGNGRKTIRQTYFTEDDYCSINGTKLKPKDEVNIRCIKNRLTAMINDDEDTTQLKLIYTSLDLLIHDWKHIAASILIFLVFIKEVIYSILFISFY